jgi:hypothetical protein
MSGRRTFLGLVILALGMFLLGQRLARDAELMMLVRTWWPLGLVALGLTNVIRLVDRPWAWALVGPLAIMVLGIVVLLHNLDRISPKLWSLLWPLILVLVGLWIALVGIRWQRSSPSVDPTFRRLIWLGGERIIRGPGPFEHAALTVLLGAAKLDLRAATLAGATIDVFVFLGTVQVLVPHGKDIDERRAFVLRHDRLHFTALLPQGADLTINILGLLGDVTVTRSSLWVPSREVTAPTAPNG